MQRSDYVSAASEDEAVHTRLLSQLTIITKALLRSTVGKALLTLAVVLLVVVVATTYGQIRLNRWNKPFYDALSRRDFRDFLFQLGVFFLIVGALLIVHVVPRWRG